MANIQTFVNIRKFSDIKLADKPVVLNFKPFSFHLINKLMYDLRIADPYIHRCQITNLAEH